MSKKLTVFTNLNIVISLFLLTSICYLNVFNAGFVIDDKTIIQNNPQIGNFSEVFRQPLYFFRPLFLYTSHTFGGLNPWAYRIVNLAFHFGSAVCLFLLIKKLTTKKIAIFTSMLFAVHPINSEAVTWISAETYPQYTFFILLSLLSYVYTKTNNRWWIVSLISALLALLSSQKAVILPLLIVLTEYCFYSVKRSYRYVLPYFLISGFIGSIFIFDISKKITSLKIYDFNYHTSFNNPLLQIPFSLYTYIKLLIFPVGFTFYHQKLPLNIHDYIATYIVLSLFIVALIISLKKNKVALFGIVFFLIALLPTLLPINIYMINAERYAYLPSIGILSIFAMGFDWLTKYRSYKLLGYFLFICLVVLYGILTIHRNNDWLDEDALLLATVKTSPFSADAQINAGNVYLQNGDYQNALMYYQKAIDIEPGQGNFYINAGYASMMLNENDKAIKFYKKALLYNPTLWQAYQQLGYIYYQRKEYLDSENMLRRATSIHRSDARLYAAFGEILLLENKYEEARDMFNKALQIDPGLTKVREDLKKL